MDSLSQFSELPNEVLIEIFRKIHHKSIFKLVLEDMKSQSFFSFLIKADDLWLSLIQKHFPYVSEHFSLSYEMIKGKYPWREFTDTPFDRFLCSIYLSKFDHCKGGFLKSAARYLKGDNEAQIEVPESIHPSLFSEQKDVVLKAKWTSEVVYNYAKIKSSEHSFYGKVTSKNGDFELLIRAKIQQSSQGVRDFFISFGIQSKILGNKFPLWAKKQTMGGYRFEYPRTLSQPPFRQNQDLFLRTLLGLDIQSSIDILSKNILNEFTQSYKFYSEIMEILFIN
nr:hypothetical protein pmam_386 [Pithovirus mammoth]